MDRYNSLHKYFYEHFGAKVLKLSLDAGFSCPNRDGKLGIGGCLFCTERAAGEFTTSSSKMSIAKQIEIQKNTPKNRRTGGKFIAYFQNFTNTYGSIEYLKEVYYEALHDESVVGLAIATRADCLGDEVMELLDELSQKTFLWVELGMQTVREETIDIINRGYSHTVFDAALNRLRECGIRTVAHTIFGLPGETHADMMKSIEYMNDSKLFGIKIHSLYVQSDSPIAELYLRGDLKLLEKEEYIRLVVEAIGRLSPEIVIHRITGDPDRSKLIAPKWTADKLSVIGAINKRLKEFGIVQGSLIK